MDVDSDEIITILCKLVDSEKLKVTSDKYSRFSVEDILNADRRGQLVEQSSETAISQGGDATYVIKSVGDNVQHHSLSIFNPKLTAISAGACLIVWVYWYRRPKFPMQIFKWSAGAILGGLAYSGLKVFYSRTLKYFFGGHELSLSIQVAPVSSVLKDLPPTDKNYLTLKTRQIMQEYCITNKDELAEEIEKDSSLVREIILRHIKKYMEEDLSMPMVLKT